MPRGSGRATALEIERLDPPASRPVPNSLRRLRRSSTSSPGPWPARPGSAGRPGARSARRSTISGTRRGAAAPPRATRPPSPRRRPARSPPGQSEGRSSGRSRILPASFGRVTSPSKIDRVAEPQLAVEAPQPRRTRAISYDADLRAGIRSRRTAAARSRSSRRLRGYMRATDSTVGPERRTRRRPRRSGGASQSRSIGSGTTAMRRAWDAVEASWATDAGVRGSARPRGRRAHVGPLPSAPARASRARTQPRSFRSSSAMIPLSITTKRHAARDAPTGSRRGRRRP